MTAIADITPEMLGALSPDEQDEALELLGAQTGIAGEGLREFILRVIPRRPPQPHHEPLIRVIERARHERVKVCVSLPPRHGKTSIVLAALAWWLRGAPADTCGYASYNETLGKSKSRLARAIALRAGVFLADDSSSVGEWRTPQGGGLLAGGVGSGFTGHGVSGLMIVDDPFKDREQANSPTIRENVWQWFTDVVVTRLEGGSMLVIHCIAGGERVPMADGTWRRIEEVVPGDLVVGYDTAGHKTVAKEVLNQKCSGEDDIFEIRTDHYVLRANAAHPLLVVPEDGRSRRELRYAWRTVRDLKPGDVVVGLKCFDNGASADTLKALGVPSDDDFGWLFGYLLGDGWVTRYVQRNRGNAEQWAVCCALSDERRTYPRPGGIRNQRRVIAAPASGAENNERLVSLLAFYFGSTPYQTGFGYVRCDDNAAGKFLSTLGLTPGKNAKRKTVPDWVYRAPLTFRRAFLRGLLDADGSKPKKGRAYRLGVSSPELVNGARHLAMTSGARATYSPFQVREVTPPHSRTKVTSTISFSDIVVDGIDKEPEGVGCVQGWSGLDTRLVKVRSIAPAGRAKVYDLTVAGHENFFPGGLCAHNTRWDLDDLIGRLIEQGGWEVINLPALAEEGDQLGRGVGEALWPSRFPADELQAIAKTIGPHSFASLYGGNPQPRGTKVFHRELVRYDPARLDLTGWTIVIGGDPTGSDSRTADYAAIVVQAIRGRGAEARSRILHVHREQMTIPAFARKLRELQVRYHNAPAYVESTGGFKGVRQILSEIAPGAASYEAPTNVSKLLRAEMFAAACNDGRVELPTGAPWVEDYCKELREFTGKDGGVDDQVDASAHGWNAAAKMTAVKPSVRVHAIG